jgi:hypothetical protein
VYELSFIFFEYGYVNEYEYVDITYKPLPVKRSFSEVGRAAPWEPRAPARVIQMELHHALKIVHVHSEAVPVLVYELSFIFFEYEYVNENEYVFYLGNSEACPL